MSKPQRGIGNGNDLPDPVEAVAPGWKRPKINVETEQASVVTTFEESWHDCWVNINGEFVQGQDATVSILDWSFVYGDGVFEGVSVVDGKILKLDRHMDRLYKSANRSAIDIPISKAEMADRWKETARRNDMTEGYMRPLVSRGEGPMGISNKDEVDGPNIYVIPQVHRTGGMTDLGSARARISSVRSPSPVARDPRVKLNHYTPNILAVDELDGTDADVPIRLNDDGFVTEAAAANVFVVTDGTVMTPPEHQILVGTTRTELLELLKTDDQWDAEVSELTPYSLYTADEVFVTGSISGIKAITHLNGRAIGDGEIGPATREIHELLSESLLDSGAPTE